MKKKTILIIILFIVIITFCITLLYVHNITSRNERTNQDKIELKNKDNKVTNEIPDNIKKSYNLIDPYINASRKYIYYEGMYQDKKIEASDLSSESKISYLVKRIAEDGYFKNRLYYEKNADIDTLKPITKEEADSIKKNDSEYYEIILEEYPNVKKEVFRKYAINLLGEQKIEYFTFFLDGEESLILCEYNNEYSCISAIGGGTGARPKYTRLYEKYEENETELIIYDKNLFYIDIYKNDIEYRYYFRTLNDLNKSYSAENYEIITDKLLIYKKDITEIEDADSINNEVLEEYGMQYKSIFRKNDLGEYYWISSEPLK